MTTPLGSRLNPVLHVLTRLVVRAADKAAETGPSEPRPNAAPSGLLRLLERRAPRVSVRDERLTRPDDTTLRVRIHDPALPGLRPVVVHAHGGGFKVGSPEELDSHLATLAHEAGVVVVSVDYRMLPEHVYPAALDDMLLAVQWVVSHAARLRVAPSRMALTGGSAGGNLALATTLALPKDLPPLRLLLLCEPWLDLSSDGVSPAALEKFYDVFREDHQWCTETYAGTLPVDDPRISPGLSPDIGTLPPTVVLVGDHDLLASSHITFVERLRKEGVQATLHVFPGLIHGTHAFTRLGPAREYELAAIAHLRSELVVGSAR